MGEVNDFDDLLAALTDESNVQPRGISNQHSNLHMHSNASLNSLTDGIAFNLHDQPSLGLTTGSHLENQIMSHGRSAGIGQNMSGNISSDILASSIVDDAFSHQNQSADSSSMQAGSSLGSLFLDSVDEILSNEKTTQHFPPPHGKAPAQKAPKPKMTKQAQLLNEKTSHQGAAVVQNTIDASPLSGSHHAHQSGSINAFSPANRVQTSLPGSSNTSGGHAYIGRQQTVQLTRPRSNASDASFYAGSVPMPSPAGSVDSNINPRTPLSNNPLTPKSMRPATPQSNLSHVNHNNRPTSASSQPHIQQHIAAIPEHDFLPVDHSQPLSSILDDQSHLQYLNTSSSSTASQLSAVQTSSYQTSGPFMQGQDLMLTEELNEEFGSYPLVNMQQTTGSLSQSSWPQSVLATSNVNTSHGQAVSRLDFASQKKGDSHSVDVLSDIDHDSLGSLSGNAFYVATTASAHVPVTSYLTQRIGADSYATSEGLSFNRNQVLDNFPIWGKPKSQASTKTTESRSMLDHQMGLQDLQIGHNDKPAKAQHPLEASPVAQEQLRTGSTGKLLHASSSTLKQVFPQALVYEAVSPASLDHSPMRKDTTQRLRESLPSEVSGVARNLSSSSVVSAPSSHVGSAPVQRRTSEDKSKSGPLARRRSASKEKKSVPKPPKKEGSAEFNFEDEFGLDPNEPTIRLPTKRNEPGDQTALKPATADAPNTMMVQTMQRENYSDPSVFQSVQELAVLQQKQKSLMDALNASRSAKIPQKPSRLVPKSSNSVLSKSTTLQQEMLRSSTATVSSKPSRPRKTSKTDSTKDNASKTKTAIGSEFRTQGPRQKQSAANILESSKTDDIFYQQYFTNLTTESLSANQKTSSVTTAFPSSLIEQEMRSPHVMSSLLRNNTSETTSHLSNSNVLKANSQSSKSASEVVSRKELSRMSYVGGSFPDPRQNLIVPHSISKASTHAAVPVPITQSQGLLTSVTSTLAASSNITASITALGTSSKDSSKKNFSQLLDDLPYFNPLEVVAPRKDDQYQKSKSNDPWNMNKSEVATTVGSKTKPIVSTSTTSLPSTDRQPPNRDRPLPPRTQSQINADVLNSLLHQSGYPGLKSSTSLTDSGRLNTVKPVQSTPRSAYSALPDMSSIQFDALSHFPPSTSLPTPTNTHLSSGSITAKQIPSIQSTRSQIPARPSVRTHPSTDRLDRHQAKTLDPKPSISTSQPSNFGSVFGPKQQLRGVSDVFPNFLSPHPGTKHITGSIPSGPVSVQKSLDFLRFTQQQLEKQTSVVPSSKQPVTAAFASPLTGNFTTTTQSSLASNRSPGRSKEIGITPSRSSAQIDSHRPLPHAASYTAATPFTASGLQSSPCKLASSSVTKTVNVLNTSTSLDFSGKSNTTPSVVSGSFSLPIAKENPSTVDILKDKTYHGPKKKHILEKYTLQTQKPSQRASPLKPTSTVRPNGTKTTSNTIVSLSFDGNTANSLPAVQNLNNNAIATTVTSSAAKPSSKVVGNESKVSAENNENKSSKNKESSSIFSLFDSLLEEATESAKGSLPAKEKPDASTPAETISEPVAKKSDRTEKRKDPIESVKRPPTTSSSAKTTRTTKATSKTITSTSAPSSSAPSTKATVASSDSQPVSRSPATFPFKRRHVQSQNKKPQAAPSTVSTASTASHTKVTTALRTSRRLIEPAQKTTAAIGASKPAVTTASPATPSVLKKTLARLAPAVPIPPVSVSSKPLAAVSDSNVGLKLRITAFRSSGGRVIHQCTLMGDLLNCDNDEDENYYKRKKRKKRKKQKKQLEKIKMSRLFVPVMPLTVSLSKASKSDNSDENVDGPSFVTSYLSSDASESKRDSPSSKKQKMSTKLTKSLLTTTNRDSSTGVDSETDKTKQSKTKRTAKVVARYKLKSKMQATSSSPSSTMSFKRRPGRPPMYLAARNSQTLVSGSTPTIQLGSRSTATKSSTKLIPTPISSHQPENRVASVKLNSTPAKSTVAILPKTTQSTVCYRLPSSSSAVLGSKVIMPKVIPSTTFSVGKATVFTVSSSGGQVMATPKIQTLPTPTRTAVTHLPLKECPKTKPLVVKRVSILPKAPPATPPSEKKSTAAAALPSVVSFTSKPVKASSQIVAPKPVLATSKSSVLSMVGEMPQVIIPTITEAKDKNDSRQTKDENEFQSAFTKLISTANPLDKYVPPSIPAEYQELMDEDRLSCERCYECGDSFLFNRSLCHHYERRSILVKVRCVQCSQMLVFFNKCEILRHAREHSEHGEVMQFNGANLRPIPLSLCRKRTKDEFLAALCDSKKSLPSETRKTTACAMACTECSFVTDGKETLEEHFQRRDNDFQPCDICKLPLHNQCVFAAHMRMHRHATPHTCPECGQTFDGNKMEFNLHLRIQCFHLSRTSCYKCKLCNIAFLTDDQLRHHLRQNHVQIFYKCRECPMAFKTTQNIANHQRSAHNLTPEPTNMLKTVYKCHLCESVYSDSNNSQQLYVLHKHFDAHIESARITAYKCHQCTRLFEQKAPLREHLQQDHDFSALDEVNCAVDVAVESGHAKPVHQSAAVDGESRPNLKASKSKSEAIDSDSSPDSRLNTRKRRANGRPPRAVPKSKIKKLHQKFKMRIKGLKREAKLASRHASSSSSISNDSPPLPPASLSPPPLPAPPSSVELTPSKTFVINAEGKKTFPCPECDKEFLSSHSRSSHVSSVHRGIRALYCCTHCPVGTVKFAKRITLVKHLSKVHGIKSPKKDEIKIIRTHVPFIPGEKFKAASVKMDKNGVVVEDRKNPPEKKQPRKKFTAGQARARRLAVAAGKRMRRSMTGGTTPSESEESYGEVDEKMVEEGWHVEDEPSPKSEVEEEVDASFFNFPDIYTCVKCNFQHSDRIVFQDHIIDHSQALEPSEVHNIASALTMVQCTECGLCFASGASLDKHMHIKHKIKRRALLERYDAKLREERQSLLASGAITDAAAVPGSSHSSFHRCKVCLRKFEKEPELKTHMRTHGLAFVKSKHH